MNNEYNMTFSEVLDEIFDTHGWYQGQGFADGVFITVDKDCDTVVLKEFNISHHFGALNLRSLVVTRGVTKMKYRRCYTQPEIERKVK